MLRHFRASLVMLALMTALLGIAYPLAMVGVAGAAFPGQAGGSLVEKDSKVVGSSLIGQSFIGETYFHGRLSATTDTDPADSTKTVASPYNAANSMGSNLGPTSQALIDRVKVDAEKLGKGVPVELVTTSGSGLDPHISPEAATWQVARVAKARNLPEAEVQALVANNTEGRMYGLLGEPRVNVLQLNLALDSLPKR
jgi:K+-transporting ATPase ATPase C chain